MIALKSEEDKVAVLEKVRLVLSGREIGYFAFLKGKVREEEEKIRSPSSALWDDYGLSDQWS